MVANPHWLPAGLLTRGTLRQQVDHWLGEISSDPSRSAGRRDPCGRRRRSDVVVAASAEEPVAAYFDSRDRWKIRCFGRLRIYRNDGSQVNWDIPGGATRKTKTLFAYLLQKGGQGGTTDELVRSVVARADKSRPRATGSTTPSDVCARP